MTEAEVIPELVEAMASWYEDSGNQFAAANQLRRIEKRKKLIVREYNRGYQKALEDVGRFLDEHLKSNDE